MNSLSEYHCSGKEYDGKISKYCIYEKGGLPITVQSHKNSTEDLMSYKAVLAAILLAKNRDIVYTDNIHLIKCVYGKRTPHYGFLFKYVEEIKHIISKNPKIELRWIRKKDNLAYQKLYTKI